MSSAGGVPFHPDVTPAVARTDGGARVAAAGYSPARRRSC